MISVIVPLAALFAGFFLVYHSNLVVPFGYANYLAVAVLAALDTVVGGIRAGQEHRFQRDIFFSGFFINAIAAGALSYFGDVIGVPLTLVATIVFGYRIFQNVSLIRTYWVTAHRRSATTAILGAQNSGTSVTVENSAPGMVAAADSVRVSSDFGSMAEPRRLT